MFVALRKIARAMSLLIIGLTLFTVSADDAYAQRKKKNQDAFQERTGKSYLLPYSLVVLGVALGVIIIARPSVRAEQTKRVIDDEEN
jgi:hypothetical protein